MTANSTEMTEAEHRVFQYVSSGNCADFSSFGKGDPSQVGESWGSERTIRADFVRRLALGLLNTDTLIHPRGIRINCAKIVGQLDLSWCVFDRPLVLTYCYFETGIVLRHAQLRTVALNGSYIGQVEDKNGKKRKSIDAEDVSIDGSLYLRGGFKAEGCVKLQNATISGDLSCNGAIIRNESEIALDARGIKVHGSVHLRRRALEDKEPECFRAKGQVNFRLAKIGGDLDCLGVRCEYGSKDNVQDEESWDTGAQNKGHLEKESCWYDRRRHEEKYAFVADELNVKGGALFNGMTVQGGMTMLVANIGLNLAFRNTKLVCGPQFALYAHGLRVGRTLYLSEGFRSAGQVRLRDAHIGADLDCRGATFSATKSSKNNVVLNIDGSRIAGKLFWTKPSDQADIPQSLRKHIKATGTIVFTNAKVGQLADSEESWAGCDGDLCLDGFVYGSLARSAPTDPNWRRQWLERQPEFHPQSYEQLASVLRNMGHEEEAKEIVMAKKDRRLKFGGLHWLQYLGLGFLKITVGYGYRLRRPFVGLLSFIALGTLLFGIAEHVGGIAPKAPLGEGPDFCPLAYSVDVFIPVLNLHQEENYHVLAWWALFYMWIHIIVGWATTTLLVAGLTGFIKKE